MEGEWMMGPIKIPWFRRPGPSWSLVYLVRGGSRPNLTEGSLSAAMGCFVQGYLVELGWMFRAPSHNRLSCGAIWRQNRRLEDTYHVLTGKRMDIWVAFENVELTPPVKMYVQYGHHWGLGSLDSWIEPCRLCPPADRRSGSLTAFRRNFGSLPASPPFRGKSERLAFPSSPHGRFSARKGESYLHGQRAPVIASAQNVGASSERSRTTSKEEAKKRAKSNSYKGAEGEVSGGAGVRHSEGGRDRSTCGLEIFGYLRLWRSTMRKKGDEANCPVYGN
ncbi:hypothetical protein M5K25_001787 [Dendrobium thyrsiflorum]|uniref:Uncharacterized protein n=1 Tax=Dendrobium thyrsiflorum TaxID=117978 RepID=A0ABD0VRF1_DENTH